MSEQHKCPGWLRRELDAVHAEVSEWPDYMKREAGIDPATHPNPKDIQIAELELALQQAQLRFEELEHDCGFECRIASQLMAAEADAARLKDDVETLESTLSSERAAYEQDIRRLKEENDRLTAKMAGVDAAAVTLEECCESVEAECDTAREMRDHYKARYHEERLAGASLLQVLRSCVEALVVAHTFTCDYEDDRPCTTTNCHIAAALSLARPLLGEAT